MTSVLRHRGPDGEGSWSAPGVALGHRRLSIIDLIARRRPAHGARLARAHLQRRDLQLRRRCARQLPGPWRSTGDTEVLLHLLAREGTACLSKVVGMFAFAIWEAGCPAPAPRARPAGHQAAVLPDPARRHRVRLGAEGAAGARLSPQIDASAVRDYLFHGYVPAPKSIYRGICEAAGRAYADLAGRPRAHRALLGALDGHRGAQRRARR